jgi:hypothetical protein
MRRQVRHSYFSRSRAPNTAAAVTVKACHGKMVKSEHPRKSLEMTRRADVCDALELLAGRVFK